MNERTKWDGWSAKLQDIVERDAWAEGERLFAAEDGQTAAQAGSVDLVRWRDLPKPQPQRWVVTNWIPSGYLTLLTGKGGAGKSVLAMQLAAAVAANDPRSADWIDSAKPAEVALDNAANGPAVYACWEDDGPQIASRLAAISGPGAAWMTPDAPLYIAALRSRGPLWEAAGRYALADRTALAAGLLSAVDRLESPPAIVVLDSSAAIYADNEIDRRSVRAFLAWLDSWAEATGAAVVIVAHPPKSDEDYSGSTDWLAGVRSLITLKSEPHGPKPKRNQPDNRTKAWKLASVKTSYAAQPDAVRLERVAGPDGFRWRADGFWDRTERREYDETE